MKVMNVILFMEENINVSRQIIKKEQTVIKNAIWIYFWLLIFEGGLRKWFLPNQSDLLLIIRDPLAIFIIIKAYASTNVRINILIFSILIISILSFIATLLLGHSNIIVAIYGLRIYIIHFHLMFIISEIIEYNDVVRFGKAIVIIIIPMTLLLVTQFYSPQSSWVNRGVGGNEEGSGFSGAAGYFRSSGTFSFTNGLVCFYGIAIPYILFFWLKKSGLNRLLLILATIAYVISVPYSISRTLFFNTCISIIFLVVATSKQPKIFLKICTVLFIITTLYIYLSYTSILKDSLNAFSQRFYSASETEGGLNGMFFVRFLGGMLNPVETSNNFPVFGYGLGMGTNAGASLLTGKVSYLIAENEWGRVIGEMGILLGLILLFIRLGIALSLLKKSFSYVSVNILPWLLCSNCFLNIIQGLWAQPTALGFTIFFSGLAFAVINNNKSIR